jgi:hypothetical protein
MQIFQTKWFARWSAKEGISPKSLVTAVDEIEHGLINAHLGTHLYKKRIAVGGRGKSSGLRIIVAYQIENKAFYLYGFAKNQQDNIDSRELRALKLMATELLNYDFHELEKALQSQELFEVHHDET